MSIQVSYVPKMLIAETVIGNDELNIGEAYTKLVSHSLKQIVKKKTTKKLRVIDW